MLQRRHHVLNAQTHGNMYADAMQSSSYLARRNTVNLDRLPHGTTPKQVRAFLENLGYPAERYDKFHVSSRVVHWGTYVVHTGAGNGVPWWPCVLITPCPQPRPHAAHALRLRDALCVCLHTGTSFAR